MNTFVSKSEEIFACNGALYIARLELHRNERTAWFEVVEVIDENERVIGLTNVACAKAYRMFDSACPRKQRLGCDYETRAVAWNRRDPSFYVR